MKLSVNRKWIEQHTFAEFIKMSFAKDLSYKEQVLLWEHNGGKKVKQKKDKEEGQE